jgi:O-acetyl-ADP-ribose deacetylase (regulator of RNase III)
VANASRVAVRAVRDALADHPQIQRVTLVCFSVGDREAYQEALDELRQESDG